MTAFIILWFLVDMCWRFSCREAFEYKQHKAALKKLYKERTALAKILGLYPSSHTHAPHHMRRYKIMRLVNLLVGALCIVLMPATEIKPYPQVGFAVHFLCFLLFALIERFTLSDINEKIPDFSRSRKP